MTKELENDRPKIRWCSPEKPAPEQKIANANRQRQQKKRNKRETRRKVDRE